MIGSYSNPGKEQPLTIRIYDRVTWHYGRGGKFSFIVYQETGGTTSVFYRAYPWDKVKRHFLISNVSASYRLGGLVLNQQSKQTGSSPHAKPP